MYYKNISNSVKTFYGVQFKPNETKEVPGFINDIRMIRVEEPAHTLKTNTRPDKKKQVKEEASLPVEAVEESKLNPKEEA